MCLLPGKKRHYRHQLKVRGLRAGLQAFFFFFFFFSFLLPQQEVGVLKCLRTV